MTGHRRIAALGLAAVVLLLHHPAEAAASLTSEEEKGRRIYSSGAGVSGNEIVAYFGNDLIEMRGMRANCDGCHGRDGLGRPESGVVPLDITWSNLMKTYGHVHPDGTYHEAFTEEALRSYLRDGIYPGGRKGDPAMPVYPMSDGDMTALLAYLKRLGGLNEPGITGSAIRVGVLLRSDDAASRAMEETVKAYFDDLNSRGGIYRRRVEPVFMMTEGSYREGIPRLQQKGGDVFSVLDLRGYAAKGGPAGDAETIVISLFPAASSPSGHAGRVFSLFPGMAEEARALVNFLGERFSEQDAAAVIFPSGRDNLQVVERAVEFAKVRRISIAATMEYPGGRFDAGHALESLKHEKVRYVLFIGSQNDTSVFLKKVEEAVWLDAILLPGSAAGSAPFSAPPLVRAKTYLAYPSLPLETVGREASEYHEFGRRHELAADHLWFRVSAYTAARLLVEAMKSAGRDLDQERLYAGMQAIKGYRAGIVDDISFGINRRIGSASAFVVMPEKEPNGKIRSVGAFAYE